MPTENKPSEPGLSFNTPDAGRGYIAKLFETVLRRHDYRQYIRDRLAGDFACTLAEHFEERTAREQALQQRLNVADELNDELEQLRKDAERYRWLRSRDLETIHDGGVFAGLTPANLVINEEDLDQAVDAARAKAVAP